MVKTRRLVAWEYADVAAAADANGIVRGPSPFGLTALSDRVPVMVGSQGLIEFYGRWGQGTRAGTGLRKIFLYPRMLSFYGTAVPGPNGDLNNPVPVYGADNNSRLSVASLGVAYDADTVLKPMVYRPRVVAPSAPDAVEMQTVGMELNQYRFEVFREAEPAGDDPYFQANAFEMRLWGHEAQSFGTADGAAVERPVYLEVAWEGTPNVPPTDSPFVAGDAITVLFRYGSTGG